jgi:hypothetical protein
LARSRKTLTLLPIFLVEASLLLVIFYLSYFGKSNFFKHPEALIPQTTDQ